MTEKKQSARVVPPTAKSVNSTGITVLTAQEHENISPFSIFTSEEFGKLRASTIDGEAYFGASDVAKALGYRNITDAIKRHCARVVKRDGCKIVANQHSTSTTKTVKTQMNYIPLSDVLRLVVNSKLPAAKAYERWVFEEVLPSINHRGVYETPEHRLAEQAQAQPQAIDIKAALETVVTPMLEMLKVMNRRLDRLEERSAALPVSTAGRKPLPARIAPSPRYDMAYTIKEALPVLDREYGVLYNTTGVNSLTGIYRDLVKYGYIYKDRLGYHPTAAARSAGHIIEETVSTLTYGDRNYEKTRVKITDAGLKSFSDTLREQLCGRRARA